MKKWIYGIVVGVVGFILFSYIFAFMFWCAVAYFHAPAVVRLPFPASKALTELEAVELTKRALILDGKESAGMRPVPFRHDDQQVFARNELNPNSGYVLWWLERPDASWDYQVEITRDGDEVVCEIGRPL